MSSAHTENLPADLNEHNEELADGCDNADTYLSAFSIICSFFFSLLFMMNEFLRKRRNPRHHRHQNRRFSRSDEARQLPSLSSSREAFLSPRNVFSRAKMQGFYVSRADEQSSSFLEAHIARRFLLFSEDRWFSLKRYDFGWLFNLTKKERFGCRVLLTFFTLIFFPMY